MTPINCTTTTVTTFETDHFKVVQTATGNSDNAEVFFKIERFNGGVSVCLFESKYPTLAAKEWDSAKDWACEGERAAIEAEKDADYLDYVDLMEALDFSPWAPQMDLNSQAGD